MENINVFLASSVGLADTTCIHSEVPFVEIGDDSALLKCVCVNADGRKSAFSFCF